MPATTAPLANASVQRPVRYSRVGWVYVAGLDTLEKESVYFAAAMACITERWLASASPSTNGGRPPCSSPTRAAARCVAASSSQLPGCRPIRWTSTGRSERAEPRRRTSDPNGRNVVGVPVRRRQDPTSSPSVTKYWSTNCRLRATNGIRSSQKESMT
jgi:hypothetical protein